LTHHIALETENEDYAIVIRQVGRRLIIATPRPGTASALARRIIKGYTGDDKEEKTPAIGFQTDMDED
jgi:hypothetical protein